MTAKSENNSRQLSLFKGGLLSTCHGVHSSLRTALSWSSGERAPSSNPYAATSLALAAISFCTRAALVQVPAGGVPLDQRESNSWINTSTDRSVRYVAARSRDIVLARVVRRAYGAFRMVAPHTLLGCRRDSHRRARRLKHWSSAGNSKNI